MFLLLKKSLLGTRIQSVRKEIFPRSAVCAQAFLACRTVGTDNSKCMQVASLHDFDCTLSPILNTPENLYNIAHEPEPSRNLTENLVEHQLARP